MTISNFIRILKAISEYIRKNIICIKLNVIVKILGI